MDLNKVMIIGNVTAAPEVRTTPQGAQVTSFSVATNLVWNDQNGMKQTKVEFHNVVAWRKLAEICGQFLVKGKKVYIEGRLQTRDWEDQSGNKKYKTEIIAENMIMLDRASGGFSANNSDSTENRNAPVSQSVSTPSQDSTVIEDEIKVEDIPF